MEIIEHKDLTNEQWKNVKEFVKMAILLSEDEQQAIDRQIPMTQEIFERCISAMSKYDCANSFNKLCHEYPDLLAAYENRIEKELEKVELPEKFKEEGQAQWKELCARIKAEYGIDVI